VATVYSKSFVQYEGLDGTETVEPLAGYIDIIRDVDVYANNTGVSPIHFRLIGQSGQTIWLFQVDPDTNASGHWTGRQVMDAGVAWSVETDAPMDVSVSGYQLSLP